MTNFFKRDLFRNEVLVVGQGVMHLGVPEVGWAVVFLQSSVGSGSGGGRLHVSAQVQLTKDSVSWHAVVHGGWLEVVQMLKARGVPGPVKEWHVGVAVVDGVAVSAVEVLQNVVLYDRILSLGSVHRSGCVPRDGITKRKHVLVLSVLQSVSINVDEPLRICKPRLYDEVVWLARWVDRGRVEIFLDGLPSINVSESCHLLTGFGGLD